MAKSRRVKKLIDAIVPDILTKEQIVTTLAAVAVHPDTRRFFKSADLVDPEDLAALRHNRRQTEKLLSTIMKTDKKQGRQSNERRALAHAYFLSTADSPTKAGDTHKIPTVVSRIGGLGLPLRTAYRLWNSVKNDRKLVSEGKLDLVNYSSIITRVGKYQKVSDYIRKELHKLIFKHPHVICCPDKRDTLLVPNPKDLSGKPIRVAKWLLQIPITELHQDLLSTGDQGFKLCRNEEGDVIIPDTALRALMPKRIRPMSDRYKEMCCCTICITMQMHQNNLNRFQNTFLVFLSKQTK